LAEDPASMGYRMPAEWEKHDATWVSWPKDPDTFPPDILPAVEKAYVKMVEALAGGEEVRVLVDDTRMESRVSSMLKEKERVKFQRLETVDVWVRDYGPICVRGKDVALVKWVFNAWGRKYDDLLPDDGAGERLAASTGFRVFRPRLVLEGGSIDVNGAGTLLTTEQCLLNSNRNPGMGKEELETALRNNLGVENIVWLGQGIEGDDTDGHVDDIARFVAPGRIVAAVEPSRSGSNHRALSLNRRLLDAATDEKGRPFEVVDIPMPRGVVSSDGSLPASHLNFYVGNAVVLVPTFGGESDGVALRALEGEFPRREVVGVDCRALVYGLGTIHCVTQQVPSA
jgi:agmatine deiminase